MKNKDKRSMKNTAAIGVAIVGGIVVKRMIRKIRFLTKGNALYKKEIYEAPWPEAIRWTLAKSLVSGAVVLVLKRYLSRSDQTG